MNGKLAVLIPAFNGSHYLQRSVESCARAGLSADRYGIFVVDNCSTDGSPAHLPDRDAIGAPVLVTRNECNLGRVGNWNRAVEIATEAGFRYVTFLFIGDEWLPHGSITSLLDAMDESGSVFGMAPLRIVSENGRKSRDGARVSITGPISFTDSQVLLSKSIGIGRLPFAPLQANVYRLYRERPLQFETGAGHELNADVEGTAAFLNHHPGPVTLAAEPFLLWREHSGRFFVKQDPWFVFADTRRCLRRLSASTGIQVDWKSANAIAMLAALREPSPAIPLHRRAAFAARVFRYLRQDAGGLSFRHIAGYISRKVLARQSYLSIAAVPVPPAPVAVVQRQCRP
jgi:hypothetical protein